MSTQFPFITVTHHPVRYDPFFVLTIDISKQDLRTNTTTLNYELAIEPNGCSEVYLKKFFARIYYLDEYQTSNQQVLNIVWNYDPNNHVDSLSKNNKVTQRTVLRRGEHTIHHNGYGDAKFVYFELSGTISYRKKDGTFVEDKNFVQSQDEKNKCKTELPQIDIASVPEIIVNGRDFGKPYTIKAKFTHPGSTDIKGPMGYTDINQYGYKLSYRYEFDNPWDERGYAYANQNTQEVKITIPMSDISLFKKDTDVPIVFKLETQYGLNGNSPKVGNHKTLTTTIHVPDSVIPDPPNITYIDKTSNSVVKNWKILVEKYSNLDLSITANGIYNSQITKIVLLGDAKGESANNKLNVSTGILTAGAKKYIAYCIDSRGRKSNNRELVLNVESYTEPKISKFSVNRNIDTAMVTILADWDWSSIGGKNNITTNLHYKIMSSPDWTKYNGSINKNADTILQGNFPIENPYIFQFSIKDSIGNTTKYVIKIENSPKMFDMLPGNAGMAVGKKCESNSFEVGFNAIFFGNISLFDEMGQQVTLKEYIQNIIGR